jgi:CheY-like chemotaxis protein
MARILIVEDNEPFRALLKQMLEIAGHTVTQAATGLAAIEILRLEPPDVVLTDIVMPDQDGLGVIMMVRKEIPVIAMSGGLTSSPLYLDLAKKLGARRVLAKPFTPEQLFEALEEVFGAT